MGLADISHGFAGEDEDYYMQELLTRDQYNKVQMLEKPVASIPDRHEHPSQNPAKKVPKGKAESNRQTDKTTADTKSGKSTAISVCTVVYSVCTVVNTFTQSSIKKISDNDLI